MLLKIKPLTKPEQSVEISPNATTSDLLEAVQSTFGVDPSGQRLVFKGRPLLDNSKLISQYGIHDGDKLTLIIKQQTSMADTAVPKPSFESLLRKHLAHTYNEREVEVIVSKFMHILFNRINSMSLNDIERLAEIWKQSDG